MCIQSNVQPGSAADARQAPQLASVGVRAPLASTLERIAVFAQSAAAFTQQSEVSDGASKILFKVLGPIGIHSRTSIGVCQLPKDATVEIDLIASVE